VYLYSWSVNSKPSSPSHLQWCTEKTWCVITSPHASHFANSPKNSTSVNSSHSRQSSLLNLCQSVSYLKSMPPILPSLRGGASFRSATSALKNKCSYDGSFLLTCYSISSFQGSWPPTNLWVVEAQRRSYLAHLLFDLIKHLYAWMREWISNKPLRRNILTGTPILLYILSNGTR